LHAELLANLRIGREELSKLGRRMDAVGASRAYETGGCPGESDAAQHVLIFGCAFDYFFASDLE
jgi:hypothetical protein